jgi:hypothetical protein
MSALPSFTFRCYQCHKLLKVSRAKAGAVVACPKCASELLVPNPPDAPAPGDAGGSGSAGAAAKPAPDAFPGFGPEDIRVEPGVGIEPERQPFLGIKLDRDGPPASAGHAANDAVPFFPTIQTEPVSLRPDSAARRPAKPASPSESPPFPADTFAPAALGPEETTGPPGSFPSIEMEPVSLRSEPVAKPVRPPARPAAPEPAGAQDSAIVQWPAPSNSGVPQHPVVTGADQSRPLQDPPASAQHAAAVAKRPPAPSRPERTPSAAPAPPVQAAPVYAPAPVQYAPVAPQPILQPQIPQVDPMLLASVMTATESIRTEPPSILPDRSSALRRNDLALPRTAVVLWSFFVILALAAAFTAGLLAGHFVWKTH